jgi:oligopeptide transport system permease protein
VAVDRRSLRERAPWRVKDRRYGAAVDATSAEPALAGAPTPAPEAGAPVRQTSLWRDAWHRYRRNWAAVVAAVVFAALVAFCLFWPLISPYDPYEVDFSAASEGPSLEHPLGTDSFGRDLLTRTALGGRVSIGIGFAATLAILFIGVLYGSVSGFVGGRLDNAMMRFLDALYGLPYLPFAIITIAIFGNVTFWVMVVALAIASWFTAARIVRGQIITLKQNDYVRAANAVGARWFRVLGRHLLPNTLGILIIAIFLELPAVILGEAFISFIGLGISPPDASWGAMAQDGRAVYRVHPIEIVIPSVAIATLILCANFIADGLRDALDPRTRET